jgi:chromate transporter
MARISRTKLFTTFLKLGSLAWGGPAAQMSLIREEFVEKKHWITGHRFRKASAIYQFLPGPEAHEMCVHVGTLKGGKMGGILAGLGFMAPGFFLMMIAAFLYQHFGRTALASLFLFINPVVIALLIRATHRLGTYNVIGYRGLVALIGSIALTLIGVHFTLIFLVAALWEFLWVKNKKALAIGLCSVLILLTIFIQKNFLDQKPQEIFEKSQSSTSIFLTGLKGGMLSFGGAYTTIPVLEKDMVKKYDNITRETFLDSIAIVSILPSPLLMFSTFLGYMTAGFTGALLITIAIFLPAFLFSLLGFKLFEKIMDNVAIHGILEGVSASVIGLLVVTSFNILNHSITNITTGIIFAISLFLFYRVKKAWITPAVIVCAATGGFLFA